MAEQEDDIHHRGRAPTCPLPDYFNSHICNKMIHITRILFLYIQKIIKIIHQDSSQSGRLLAPGSSASCNQAIIH